MIKQIKYYSYENVLFCEPKKVWDYLKKIMFSPRDRIRVYEKIEDGIMQVTMEYSVEFFLEIYGFDKESENENEKFNNY